MAVPTVAVPQAPWTHDLEIALFRAIMSYRPVGIHRSMRLISILNAITAQYPTAPIALHDIKNKLNELYDIPGIEEQEDSEEASTELGSDPAALPVPPQQTAHAFTEFQLPFEDVVAIIEERGKGIDGDGSVPSSPEAQMSVRSGRSGRGTKRRREESAAAVSVTDAGTEEDDLASPTTVARPKRPRNASTQRKVSASATPASSTAPKRRGRSRQTRKGDKEEGEEEDQTEEDEGEGTESVAETASVADTETAPSKSLRTSSRRKGGQEDAAKAARGGRNRGRGGRTIRGRGR